MPLLCPTAARALTGPTETTLRTLLAEYELDSGEGLLVSLTALSGHLEAFSIACVP